MVKSAMKTNQLVLGQDLLGQIFPVVIHVVGFPSGLSEYKTSHHETTTK
jgi:hypothetical protein